MVLSTVSETSSSAVVAVAASTTTTNTQDEMKTNTNNSTNIDYVDIPKSMASCLDYTDPVIALQLLADASAKRAAEQANTLQNEIIQKLQFKVPEILTTVQTNPDHPMVTVVACADSVHYSLTKIASGGSQASQEIRQLEQEKRDMDSHADAVEKALLLRRQSDRAAQSFSASAWLDAAEALKPWLEWDIDVIDKDPRVRQYTGEYSIQQLQTTYDKLKDILLQQYELAVQKSDLHILGQLTPILSILRLENEGVRLYKLYLESILDKSLQDAAKVDVEKSDNNKNADAQSIPPYVPMGRVYNTAVATLRHHLPMVSHCLYKADGAATMVQLVHVKTQECVLELLVQYQRNKQLIKVAKVATQIYAALEERYTGRSLVDLDTSDDDEADCGFATQIGNLSDVDIAMKETALCVQHAESYLRFIHHTCTEVNRARQIRHQHEMERLRMERERREWTTGQKSSSNNTDGDDKVIEEYKDLQILPSSTPLHEEIAELGGQYAAIERCLLLASMQRAFVQANYDDPRYYRPMSTLPKGGGGGGSANKVNALQTTMVETCYFAARRGLQRAFATGHTGTASAMTNFTVECMNDILLEVMTRRAEDLGVNPLRPGEGLLVGSINLFNNASNLIRQGGVAGVGVTAQPGVGGVKYKEELARKQKIEQGISFACAVVNDLEVAIHHTKQLEDMLNQAIDKGFTPDTHETEQLRMCVKSLGPVADSFRTASNSTIESLESVLKPRIRSIVGDAVGSEGSTSSTFMGATTSTVVAMGGGGVDKKRNDMIRMNYNLDEDTYNLMQLSEGYVDRLCTLLDELLQPLQTHLAPRLWDTLVLTALSTACKRLETSLRKCDYTALGGITFDSDMRDLLSYTKDRLSTSEYGSNVTIFRSCTSLSRLIQIAKIMSVDILDDVPDLIQSYKRKGQWDIKMEDVKAFLSTRLDFDITQINETLPDD